MNEKPKSKLKSALLLILLTLLVLLGVFGYFKYTAFVKLQDSANAALLENKTLKNASDNYDQLKYKMEQESDRCGKLLSKEEGNFAEFSYCQKFVEFVNNNLKD